MAGPRGDERSDRFGTVCVAYSSGSGSGVRSHGWVRWRWVGRGRSVNSKPQPSGGHIAHAQVGAFALLVAAIKSAHPAVTNSGKHKTQRCVVYI